MPPALALYPVPYAQPLYQHFGQRTGHICRSFATVPADDYHHESPHEILASSCQEHDFFCAPAHYRRAHCSRDTLADDT